MVPIQITYDGKLRCTLVHGPSGTRIQTDAPKDNQGEGLYFSPTDLTAAALGACVLTTMGILAKRHEIIMDQATAHVEKHMAQAPDRKIAKIVVAIHMPKGIALDKRPLLERAIHACPVHKSLHPDVEKAVSIVYPD